MYCKCFSHQTSIITRSCTRSILPNRLKPDSKTSDMAKARDACIDATRWTRRYRRESLARGLSSDAALHDRCHDYALTVRLNRAYLRRTRTLRWVVLSLSFSLYARGLRSNTTERIVRRSTAARSFRNLRDVAGHVSTLFESDRRLLVWRPGVNTRRTAP